MADGERTPALPPRVTAEPAATGLHVPGLRGSLTVWAKGGSRLGVLNDERIRRDVVVIGASAGGVEALTTLFARLPPALDAIVAVVLHRSRVHGSRLAEVLSRRAALPVRDARHGERPVPGTVYLAPPDRHLLVEHGRLSLSGGPHEHHTRPAVDPLFVTAARAYGPRTLGILLSGAGADGVLGLIAVRAAGGLSLVQDPREARYASMPLNAITRDRVNAVMELDVLAAAMTALVDGKTVEVAPGRRGSQVTP
jgi:two-component system chemotaxis response regulator CheB